jgi:NADH-quinone oxidoreductase subunit J
MLYKYKNLIWLTLPLILIYGLSASFALSGGAIRSLAAFFCSLWDFTLYIGVATAALGLATGVILVKSPINALFCLIGVFISSILLLLSIRVEFLSMILLIVYIGAIAILFLFVIMLLNVVEPQTANFSWSPKLILISMIGATLSYQGYNFLINGIYVNAYYNNTAFSGLTGTGQQALGQADYYIRYGLNDVTLFSDFLYTSHAPLFLLSSLVLLAAMIGAIVLAMSTIEAKAVSN